MKSDLTYDVLRYDKHFGKQLINFSISSLMDGKYQAVSMYWHVVKNKDGMYGIVGGGSNNIGSFVSWCTGLAGWCFNPLNLEEYVWSKINNAFITKNFSFLKDVRIIPNEFYYYQKDSNKEIIEFYTEKNCFDKVMLWCK